MILSEAQQQIVVTKLHSLAELPRTGCVAGQGLASIIYEVLGLDVKAPINDIDIFDISSVKIFKELSQCTKQVSLSFKGMNDRLSIVTDSYEQISYFNVTSQRGYRVIKSFTDKEQPIINKTLITFSDQSIKLIDQKFDHETLLESFDFNACQIAYDLTTKTFYYTKAFEDFLKTSILKLASLHTPLHSAVRLFKKLNDLTGVSCDVIAEMKMITTYINMHSNLSNATIPPMGKRYFKLYQKYAHLISPYFTIIERQPQTEHKMGLYTFDAQSVNDKVIVSGFHCELTSGVNFPAYYRIIAGDNVAHDCDSLIRELNDKCVNSAPTNYGEYKYFGHAFFLIKLLSNKGLSKDKYSIEGESEYLDGNYTIHSKALAPYIDYINENIQFATELAPLNFKDSISLIETIERLGINGQWLKFLITHKYIKPQSLSSHEDKHILDLLGDFKKSALKKQNSKKTIVKKLTTKSATFGGITNLYDYLNFCFSHGTGCRYFNQAEQLYIAKSITTNNEYLIRVYDTYSPLQKYTYYTSHYFAFSVDKNIDKELVNAIHRRTKVKRVLWNILLKPFAKIRHRRELQSLGYGTMACIDTDIPF
jgi:hypothetical protein